MHSISASWMRYTLAGFGIVVSLLALAASMSANAKFGYSLGGTPSDGTIYAVVFAAADVGMALMPFFFFAALRNREWLFGFITLALWVLTVAFAFSNLLGHASLNRLSVASQRTVSATNYEDVRTELAAARQERGFIPQHRDEAVVRAEITKYKISTMWNATSECTELAGASARKYCGGYEVLNIELGNSQRASKVQARIDALQARSDRVSETGGASVQSEADPEASRPAKLSFGYLNVEQAQSVLVVMVASLVMGFAGFGPYVSTSVLRQAQELLIDITPSSDNQLPTNSKLPPQGDLKALVDQSKQALDGSKGVQNPSQPPLPYHIMARLARPPHPGAVPGLKKIDYPLVKLKGELREPHVKRTGFKVAAQNFAAWLQAYELAGIYEPAQVEALYKIFAEMDHREACHTNMLMGSLNDLGRRCGVYRRSINGLRKWVVSPGRFPTVKPGKAQPALDNAQTTAQAPQGTHNPPPDANAGRVVQLRSRFWRTA